MYRLIEALDRVLGQPRAQAASTRSPASTSPCLRRCTTSRPRCGRHKGSVRFAELFDGQRVRSAVVITFLALLEMCKLGLLRVSQEEGSDDIFVSQRGAALAEFGMEGGVAPSEEFDHEYR